MRFGHRLGPCFATHRVPGAPARTEGEQEIQSESASVFALEQAVGTAMLPSVAPQARELVCGSQGWIWWVTKTTWIWWVTKTTSTPWVEGLHKVLA